MPASTADLAPREPSQRIADKSRQRQRKEQLAARKRKASNADGGLSDGPGCPGINDFSDALEAIPMDIVRHLTLLKEIDAKCVGTTPLLTQKIREFLAIPVPVEDAKVQLQREDMLGTIRGLIREIVPCLEEKMHVAGVAADEMARHIARLDYDYELIITNEIPEEIQFGPEDHPAYIAETKLANEAKSAGAATTRSESRREAMAAKKAAGTTLSVEPGTKGRHSTPSAGGGPGSRGGTATATAPVKGVAAIGGARGGRGGQGSRGAGTSTLYNAAANGRGASAGAGGHSNNAVATAIGGGASKRRKGAGADSNYSSDQGAHDGGYGNGASHGDAGETGPYNGAGYGAGANGAGAMSGIANIDTRYDGVDEEAAASPGSRPGTPTGRRARQRTRTVDAPKDDEPLYCYCQQVSFGEMVGCDGENCEREWFHLPCIGLTSPPKGQWYCQDCAGKPLKRRDKR